MSSLSKVNLLKSIKTPYISYLHNKLLFVESEACTCLRQYSATSSSSERKFINLSKPQQSRESFSIFRIAPRFHTNQVDNQFFNSKRRFHSACVKQFINNGNGKPKQMEDSKIKDAETEPVAASSKDTSSLLETWFYEVSPYGSLNAHLPFKAVIKPLNPQDYPDMNKCIIELHYDTKSNDSSLPDAHQLSQISDLYKLDVSFDKDKANMKIICKMIEAVRAPISCHLFVPLKFDLSIEMTGSEHVTVESMESDSIDIVADEGNVFLKKIKSGSISAMSKSGDIVSKSTLLGNANLHCCNSGSIDCEKLQGSSVMCTTELGALKVASLYSDNTSFKTVMGDIKLGQCHGHVVVTGQKSDVNIESLEGDLNIEVHQGSVNVHLSRHNKVDVDINTGDISLSFPEGASTDLNLSCSDISVSEDLDVKLKDSEMPLHKEGHIGRGGVSVVNARTLSGRIKLNMLDWIQATKFSFMNGKLK